MTTETSSPTPQPSQQNTPQRAPLSPGLVAGTISWFLGWPVVILACLSFMTAPISLLASVLLGTGSFLWIVSCYGICGLVLRMIETRWRVQPIYRRTVFAWFFGWIPTVFIFGWVAQLFEFSVWIDVSFVVAGSFLWLASCYGVYDMLMAMAEEKWPEAKSIREVIEHLVEAGFRSQQFRN